jgi:hypothetical protein
VTKLVAYMQLDTVLKMESSGFVQLLDAGRTDDLRRIYAIVSRIPAMGPKFIRELMAAHVKEVGKARSRRHLDLAAVACARGSGQCTRAQGDFVLQKCRTAT